MAFEDAERTEAATPKRRHEARERGQVARSAELNSALLLAGTCGALAFGGALMGQTLLGAFREGLQLGGGADLTPETIRGHLVSALWVVTRTIGPVALAGAAVGVLANVLQVGFMVAPKAIGLRWERLDPLRGLSRIVSLGGAVEAVKALLKLAILGGVAYWTLSPAWVYLPDLAGMDIPGLMAWQFDLGLRLAFRVVTVFGLLAVADYAYQRWQHERRLRMTRNEVQEEGKQQEGNPQIRARVRSLQQERRRHRMMQDVASASAVVVNPTHIAVAIAYDQRSMRAPRVVAKGKRLLAERIVHLAREAGVPVVQDIPLARTLYRLVEVGGEIPVMLYKAVAKVLAYVYGRAGRRGAAR
jgi:flagellar biosynthetic protein FlhB